MQAQTEVAPQIFEEKAKEAELSLVNQEDITAVQMSEPAYKRLSVDQLGQILILHKRGLSQRKIAEIVGCSQPTVSYSLQQLTEPAEIPQAIAKAKSRRALEQWDRAIEKAADRGDHRPARELIELAHAELRPQAGNTGGGGGVTIHIGTLEPPAINVSPVPQTVSALSPAPGIAVSADSD